MPHERIRPSKKGGFEALARKIMGMPAASLAAAKSPIKTLKKIVAAIKAGALGAVAKMGKAKESAKSKMASPGKTAGSAVLSILHTLNFLIKRLARVVTNAGRGALRMAKSMADPKYEGYKLRLPNERHQFFPSTSKRSHAIQGVQSKVEPRGDSYPYGNAKLSPDKVEVEVQKQMSYGRTASFYLTRTTTLCHGDLAPACSPRGPRLPPAPAVVLPKDQV